MSSMKGRGWRGPGLRCIRATADLRTSRGALSRRHRGPNQAQRSTSVQVTAEGGELLVEFGVVATLELDEQGGVGVLGQHGVDAGIVLADHVKEAGVHDLDGGGRQREDPGDRLAEAKTEGK